MTNLLVVVHSFIWEWYYRPLLLCFCILAVSLLVLGLAVAVTDDPPIGIGMVVSSLLVVAFLFAVTFPQDRQYHGYTKMTGTASQVGSRILRDGDSVNQKFVVMLDDGKPYGCEDTRCSLIQPGDVVTLSCKREWEWQGTDGWNCKFVDNKGPG